MVRLIATDIDGTILPAGAERIPDRTLRILSRVIEEGILLVPCSGRMLDSLPPELMELPGIRYAVSCNGAVVTDMRSGRPIYEKKLPAGQAAELLRLLRQFHVYACAYLPEGAFNYRKLPPELSVYYGSRIPFFSQNPQEDLADFIEENGVNVEKLFIAVFGAEEKTLVRRELSKIPGIHVTTSSAWNLEVNHVDADKGRALSWLCRELEIPAEEVLAMGDNENDYSMLSFAGTSVAPANAAEVIRSIAMEVTADCGRCGPAAYLEKNVLAKKC